MPLKSKGRLKLSIDISTCYIKYIMNCLDRCGTCGQRYLCELQKNETFLILISLKRYFLRPEKSILNSSTNNICH